MHINRNKQTKKNSFVHSCVFLLFLLNYNLALVTVQKCLKVFAHALHGAS